MARLPYLKRPDLDAPGQAAFDRLLAGMNTRVNLPPRTEVTGVYSLLLSSPELAARVGAVGDAILNSGIELVTKEIVCLAVAREVNCQMEWTLHEPMARRAGVREEVIQGIKLRSLKGFQAKERVFVDYTNEVLRAKVKDSTWTAIEHLMGRKGAVDLTLLITFTALISHCMDAFQDDLGELQSLLPIP